MSSRARKQQVRTIIAKAGGTCPTCGRDTREEPGQSVSVGSEVHALIEGVMPKVEKLREDVKRLMDQVQAGIHPVTLADQLEASLDRFIKSL